MRFWGANLLYPYLSLLFWSFYGGGQPLQFLTIFWKRKNISAKKLHHIYWLTIRYLWTKYEDCFFFHHVKQVSTSRSLQENSPWRCMLERTKRQLKVLFLSRNAFITTVCFLLLLKRNFALPKFRLRESSHHRNFASRVRKYLLAKLRRNEMNIPQTALDNWVQHGKTLIRKLIAFTGKATTCSTTTTLRRRLEILKPLLKGYLAIDRMKKHRKSVSSQENAGYMPPPEIAHFTIIIIIIIIITSSSSSLS